jgi:hypothetical protein
MSAPLDVNKMKARRVENEILKLRAVTQIALATHITPRVRGISLDVFPATREITFLAYSDGALPESALEALHCAVTEIQAAYPPGWTIKDEYRILEAPSTMQHLPLLAYARCEDDWVDRTLNVQVSERADVWEAHGAVHIICVSPFGDPIEMNTHEAAEFASRLATAISQAE